MRINASIMAAFLVFIVMLSSTAIVAAQEANQTAVEGTPANQTVGEQKVDLGEKYCGAQAEKKYGLLPPGSGYDRVVGPKVYYIRVEGIIDYAISDYIREAIRRAEEDNAVLILELNTPGGLLDAALDIVTEINLKSQIPVVGYVVDRWAESAGTLILVTSHVAAMQPGTIIGSMQPVAYNPATGAYEPINESKIINPIIKVLCEHGASKGRNATALVRFILHNDNYGAEEAYRYHVIEFVEPDIYSLIRDLNGSVIALPAGGKVLLRLDGTAEEIPPPPRVVILHALSDPLLSGVLLSLGMLIILFSLASGHFASASIGALLLILGLAGSGFNPNLTSLILIALGAILILVEMYTPGFGIIGGTGIVMLVLGIALLPLGGGGFAVSPAYAKRLVYTIYAIGGFFGVFTGYAVYKIIQVRRRKPIVWTIIGSRGRAVDDIGEDTPGFVIVEGEYWKAISKGGVIPKGSEIIVVGKEGPLLIVEPANRDRTPSSHTQP